MNKQLWTMMVLLTWSGTHAFADMASDAVGRTATALEKTLPRGWNITETKKDQIPWGHHWCDEYEGPKGLKLVAVGPTAVSVQLQVSGEWRSFAVAKEALEIWIMPPGYRDSWKSLFCFHAPIPATPIKGAADVALFGKPAHRLNSEQEFRELLAKSGAVTWPASPWNDPSRLSWRTWKRDIEASVGSK